MQQVLEERIVAEISASEMVEVGSARRLQGLRGRDRPMVRWRSPCQVVKQEASERLLECVAKRNVDVPMPRTMKEILERIMGRSQERVSECPGDGKHVEVRVPHIMKEILAFPWRLHLGAH